MPFGCNLAAQFSSLDRRSNRDAFVRIHVSGRFLAGNLAYLILYGRDSCRTADQKHHAEL